MAVEGATEALVAAFFFGIVLNAASATFVLYVRGYGRAVFRDSQRLVLTIFLLSSALWAQIAFITVLLNITRSPTPCQVGIIFSSTFDQLARFSIEQFLVWILNSYNGGKLSAVRMIPQVLVLARFVAGAVFIGFTRPQTDTFCVASTSALPVGALVAALDGVIVVILFVMLRLAGKRNGKVAGPGQTKALNSVILGLVFWTGTSVPLLIGIRTIALAARTALPAGGLLVLIAFVATGAETLIPSKTAQSRPPEAPSPRRINISRDISTSDSDYPPTRYEDLKEAAIRSSTTFVNPREAPRVKDETDVGFPTGLQGILRRETAAPLPVPTTAVLGPARQPERLGPEKKRLFDFAKGAAVESSGPKIAISNPILQANSAQNPLNKIVVVDLKEAAMAEKERRARMQEEPEMDANRSAVRSMTLTPEEGLRRAVSLKRKEVSSVSVRNSPFPGSLQSEDEAVASTTSARLSPGGDATRRRSPRILTQEPAQAQQQLSSARLTRVPQFGPESPQDWPIAVPEQVSVPQPPVTRPGIRPSRMLPPSPKTPPPEPTKTPLQRRPTIGLPSNPRARGLKMAQEAGEKAIMFVNSIEYNDPVGVQTIIQGASDRAMKTASGTETPGTSASVVNRPRPIPRKPAESPSQPTPSPAHRRSKSGGSLGRKSFLTSAPGSPTNLPPLPPPPMSAIMPSRPHPNDTKSMTVDEKMILLFPSSTTSGNTVNPISSVPSVPNVPAWYSGIASSPSDSGDRRTTKTSVRTESVLEVDEIPPKPGKSIVNTADEAGSSWLRAFGVGSVDGKSSSKGPSRQGDGAKRESSPVIPTGPARVSAWTETTDDRTQDDATTIWSSMHSPEVAIRVPVLQKVGLPSSVRMPARQDAAFKTRSDTSSADGRNSDTLPIMLDTSTIQQAVVQPLSAPESETTATPERATQSQWHRRVGDECPTFSERMAKRRSRRMSPPTPLLLNAPPTKRMITVQVEASPPPSLESPGQALEQIQAQLKNLEDPTLAPVGSPNQRLALLENLEKEMGQQASHWQEIKHGMDRDSMSSIQTASPSGRSSQRESLATDNTSRHSYLRPGIAAERRASRVARLNSNSNTKGPGMSVRDSGSPQLSNWQKRLTEAQMDYMDAQLLRSSSVKFMQLTRPQLASPTPPDSDHSDEELPPLPSNLEKEKAKDLPVTPPKPASLWMPEPSISSAPAGFLWIPVPSTSVELEAPLPGLSLRPKRRNQFAPLQVQSSQLWRKPYSTANRSTSGLWRPIWASAAPPADPAHLSSQGPPQAQKAPRQVISRPPRRSKRITLLPDILESPEPLPDQRGTLGIFQFPWGEKSNTASIQPRSTMFMAMPGTMTSGGPPPGVVTEHHSKQPEVDEYSSSFFDDYDDGEEEDVDMDSEGEDSEDDFDETTLWEIASLLKTDAVPSKDSLLPPPSSSVVDDYMDELASEEDGQSSREQSIVIGLAAPREFLFEQQGSIATEGPVPKPAISIGLPANPKASLNARTAGSAAASATPIPAPALSQITIHIETRVADTVKKQESVSLWGPAGQADDLHPQGLFAPGSNRSNYRSTAEEPAAKYMTRKSRRFESKPLDRLMSTHLWVPLTAPRRSKRNWIQAERKHPRPQASPDDWKAALAEATSASYPKKPRRVVASPAEWEAALHEAIKRSARRPPSSFSQPAFDSAVRHPVFAASSLVTRSEWFHPAATGYTYDVSTVHPVFFGSLAITCPVEAVHPAMSAYAAKKLRRQQSRQRQHSVSRSRSGSRGSSSQDQQREETRAQDQEFPASAPVRARPLSQRDAIQAQIEALEEERLFAQRIAQEEVQRRRMSGASSSTPLYIDLEPTPVIADTVQDLQRHLSQQIRRSLVFGSTKLQEEELPPSPSPVPPVPPVPAVLPAAAATELPSRTRSKRKSSSSSSSERKAKSGKSLLWTPTPSLPPPRVGVPAAKEEAKGLWTADQTGRSSSLSWSLPAKEDREAAARRTRRRKLLQRKQRRAEILAQIAAVEAGLNPFVDFSGQRLWPVVASGSEERGRRDWLHDACVLRQERKTKGVVLRY